MVRKRWSCLFSVGPGLRTPHTSKPTLVASAGHSGTPSFLVMLALLPSEAAANSGRGEGPFGAQLDNPCARRCQLQLLPPELLEALLGLLGAVDLVKLACGNKRFSSLILVRMRPQSFLRTLEHEAPCPPRGGLAALVALRVYTP